MPKNVPPPGGEPAETIPIPDPQMPEHIDNAPGVLVFLEGGGFNIIFPDQQANLNLTPN